MTSEPILENQPELLKMLFDRMPMGVAIFDRNFNITRFNSTWAEFAQLYAPSSAMPLTPGVNYFDLLPGSEAIVIPLFERVLAGETIRQNATEFISGGIISYWDMVLAPLIHNGEVNGILNVTNDVTEYTSLQQNLERRVKDGTHELRTLLQITRDMNSNLDLEKVLDTILDELKTIVNYSGASILTFDGEHLVLRTKQGKFTNKPEILKRFPIEETLTKHKDFKNKKVLIIPDIHGESELARIFRDAAGEEIRSTFADIHSWMSVPITSKRNTLGMLTLVHHNPDHFTSHQVDLVLTIANHAAAALENAQLYLEAEQRAQENEALFLVQQAITSKLEVDEVLQMIANEARRLTKTDISAVYLLKGDKLEISYVSGDVPSSILGYRLDLENSIAGKVIKEQRAILVHDTWDNPDVDRSASDQVQARSLLIVPLISGEEPVGTITVANHTPGAFRPGVEKLLTRLAANVVICLVNAHLYESEQDRREVAEGLRETLVVLNSKKPLDEILDHIASQAVRVMGASSSIIYQIEPKSRELIIQAGCRIPEAIRDLGAIPIYQGGAVESMFNRAPYIIHDIAVHLKKADLSPIGENRVLKEWMRIIREDFSSFIGVPLIIDNELYGSMGLYYRNVKDFSEEHIELGMALANQAVLAIENARLLEQSEDAAIAAERNRLARDLHDAVTQTLFSASMIADVLPKIWDQSEEEGHRRLEELRQLTRGALSEMRTLLVELRPAALVEADLGDLVGHQVNAFIARTRIPVSYQKECVYNPPTEIKEMFYRIVQEAFNNIAKHANAASIQVQLRSHANKTELIINDDGVGFDVNSVNNQGLGLAIMKERVHNAGAEITINSQIGQGTSIQITWQKDSMKEKSNE